MAVATAMPGQHNNKM